MNRRVWGVFCWNGELHYSLPHWVFSEAGGFVDNTLRLQIDEETARSRIGLSIYKFNDPQEQCIWRKKKYKGIKI